MSRADAALLLGLGLILGLLYSHYWRPAEPAQSVTIIHGDRVIARHPLNQDLDLHPVGRLGPSHIEIRDGRVRFVHAPCRQKICLRAGWLQRSGAVAACVPNQLALVLSGGKQALDGVTY